MTWREQDLWAALEKALMALDLISDEMGLDEEQRELYEQASTTYDAYRTLKPRPDPIIPEDR